MIASLENCYVLIVDDHQDTRDLLVTALEMEGAIVIAVDSAIAALKTLEQCRPDILLCDLAMPNVDGFSLMKHLRSHSCPQWNQLPSIAMTAMEGVHYQQQAIEVGFQRYFSKPIDLDRLIQAIESLVVPTKNRLQMQALNRSLEQTDSTACLLGPLSVTSRTGWIRIIPSLGVEQSTLAGDNSVHHRTFVEKLCSMLYHDRVCFRSESQSL